MHLQIYDKFWTLIFYMLLFYDFQAAKNINEHLSSNQQPQE
jgi:hypothetical protein